MSNQQLPKFKLEIDDIVTSYDRNMKIIDREYRHKSIYKNGKTYNCNEKWYKYKCLKCGNIDWIIENAFVGRQHVGCNACCQSPKKVIPGINDITTTAPWMVKYFENSEDATKYTKGSKKVIDFVCPDCGRHHKNKISTLYTTHNLSCPCQDSWSYPNKFMYSVLEQAGVNFEAEKIFDWSDSKKYDDYIEYDGLKIITEQHGIQHYERKINKNAKSVEEEQENDKLKYNLVIKNGIDKYIVLDCRESTKEYIKSSIINSELFSILNISPENINFDECDKFASSNMVKQICNYRNEHPDMTMKEIAPLFHVCHDTIRRWVKKGAKLGWCTYEIFDDLKLRYQREDIPVNNRPIHCITTDTYHRSATKFVEYYQSLTGKKLCDRNIRSVCTGKRNHVNNMKFKYITQEQFNKLKEEYPDKVYGELFVSHAS